MATVFEQLQAIRSLPENWDGYGAASPQAPVVDVAAAFAGFLSAALDRSKTAPAELHVSPTRVGGVLIEWEDPTSQHEVEFNPDHCISFLHRHKATGEITTRFFAPVPHMVVHPDLLSELGRLLAA